jgi:hypothetical protein
MGVALLRATAILAPVLPAGNPHNQERSQNDL